MPEIRVKDIKMLREHLCAAQGFVNRAESTSAWKEEVARELQDLIDECDRHRPLGPDGKHGNRHTDTCGCEDKGPMLVHDYLLAYKYIAPLCGVICPAWQLAQIPEAVTCQTCLDLSGGKPYLGRL